MVVTIQKAGEVAESLSSTIESRVAVVSATNGDSGILREQVVPVNYEGEKLVIDPSVMTPGEIYSFDLYGVRAFAIKEADGAVSVFYLPE